MRALGAGVAIAVLAGCVSPNPYTTAVLPKGEQLDVRNILAANPNKRACFEYQAATNSCSSIITATVSGDIMTSREIGAVKVPGANQTAQVEVVSRSRLYAKYACVKPEDISVTGRDQMSLILLGATRDLIKQFGGSICTTYHRSGDGYVASSVGANGQPFPPGNAPFQFITGEAKLRAH
jgi:hypothetical protein